MNKILNHDPIADGLFNRDYCAANGPLKPWAEILSSTPQSLELSLDRLEADFKSLNVKMRKAFGSKDVEPQQLTSDLGAVTLKLRDSFFIFSLTCHCCV